MSTLVDSFDSQPFRSRASLLPGRDCNPGIPNPGIAIPKSRDYERPNPGISGLENNVLTLLLRVKCIR